MENYQITRALSSLAKDNNIDFDTLETQGFEHKFLDVNGDVLNGQFTKIQIEQKSFEMEQNDKIAFEQIKLERENILAKLGITDDEAKLLLS